MSKLERTVYHPHIISASRATDIPAFFSEWFFEQLEKGYIEKENPFNRNKYIISFDKVRVIVFWSKYPKPIIPYLKILDKKNINYYFQFTLNDYEEEKFEPFVPSLKERIEIFKELSSQIGKEKVIWRFDPIILTEKTTIEKIIKKIEFIGNEINAFTEKLVISFLDLYPKVKRRFLKYSIPVKEISINDMHLTAKELQGINRKWGLKIRTCSENIDLTNYDIYPNKCIDDKLMIRLFHNDSELMQFLEADTYLFQPHNTPSKLKDKGQRKYCNCIVSKDIGKYNTCKYRCLYCYAVR